MYLYNPHKDPYINPLKPFEILINPNTKLHAIKRQEPFKPRGTEEQRSRLAFGSTSARMSKGGCTSSNRLRAMWGFPKIRGTLFWGS